MSGDQSPVLIPLDGSKNAENAIPMGVFLANAYGAPLQLLHVADGGELNSAPDLEKAVTLFSGYTHDLMAHYSVEAGYRTTLLAGKPASVILEAIAASPTHPAARAVVLSTHGIGGLKSSLIGSVADKVIRATSVPALVVPGIGPASIPSSNPVIVGVDGSEMAECGLSQARTMATYLKASLIVVRACQYPSSIGHQFAYYYPPNLLEIIEDAARDYLDHIIQPGETPMVVEGAPASRLFAVAEANNASMVVVTSHGRGFASRLALGSTTAALMHSIKRPLLVVPVG